MQLSELVSVLEEIAPSRFAEPWDNVGLLCGDLKQSLSRVMLCIDYTKQVADEARSQKCDAVIAYHPPIFDGLKKITGDGPAALVFDAVSSGIALYSPHTALDVADGGTNDLLADILGLTSRRPLRIAPTTSDTCKLIVFVPQPQLQQVSDALFAAGAGRIGNYSSCSFRSTGTGTFFGEAGSDPQIGKAGRLETVEEVRLETIVPKNKIEAVIAALRKSHPYEQPAFDVYLLESTATPIGLGRIGAVPSPTPLSKLIERIKIGLEIDSLLVTGEDRTITTAAMCAGAGGSLLPYVLAQKADLYLTGELRHHDALKATAAGMTVICTLHSNSERAILKRLKSRLEQRLAPVQFLVSQTDRDPFLIR
jgi:dinuclear metal center YbgI/SA1388 family protein